MNESLVMLTLLVHAASTCAMMGLIWFVQIVHYPLMGKVGSAGYANYQDAHMKRTTWVVAPLMLTELASAVVLLFVLEVSVWTIAGLIMLTLIWVSTAALQVPAHNRMLKGFDANAHRRLVGTNWVRTVLWTLRAILACVLIGMN
jgi:hypothetical protein